MLTARPPLSRLALGSSLVDSSLCSDSSGMNAPSPTGWMVWSSPCLFFFLLVFIYLIFYCKIFALHYCVGFCHTPA